MGSRRVEVRKSGMKRLFRTENAPLFLLVGYSVTLLWMLLDWKEGFGAVPWWGAILELLLGVLLIAWMTWLYKFLRRRRLSESPDSK
jgi:hypothetical protein